MNRCNSVPIRISLQVRVKQGYQQTQAGDNELMPSVCHHQLSTTSTSRAGVGETHDGYVLRHGEGGKGLKITVLWGAVSRDKQMSTATVRTSNGNRVHRQCNRQTDRRTDAVTRLVVVIQALMKNVIKQAKVLRLTHTLTQTNHLMLTPINQPSIIELLSDGGRGRRL